MVKLVKFNGSGVHCKKDDRTMTTEEAVKWLHNHGYEMTNKIVSNDGKATFYHYNKPGCGTTYYIEDREGR